MGAFDTLAGGASAALPTAAGLAAGVATQAAVNYLVPKAVNAVEKKLGEKELEEEKKKQQAKACPGKSSCCKKCGGGCCGCCRKEAPQKCCKVKSEEEADRSSIMSCVQAACNIVKGLF